MNYRVTIGFLAVAAVLAVLVYGLDKFNIGPTAASKAAATSTTTASQSPQIFSFDDSKVTTFELHQGDQSAVVEKQGSNWVVSATGAPANQASFTSLIVRMASMKATRQVDNPGDLSQYGLDSPKESAIATLDDGTKYQLDLGDKTPVQTGSYAKRADTSDVYVIPDQFSTDLERLVADPTQPPTPTPVPPTSAPSPAGAVEGTPLPTISATPGP
jgi:hypothetical protein